MEEYFDYYYKNDPQMDKMPEEKFSKDTVDHMMVIYLQTHPLLTSKRKLLKINWEIVEFLDDRWDESLLEADRKAQEIYAERQMRIKRWRKRRPKSLQVQGLPERRFSACLKGRYMEETN